MRKMTYVLLASILVLALGFTACQAPQQQPETPQADVEADAAGDAVVAEAPESQPDAEDASDERVKVRIGWTPPDVTGVFKTATDYMEMAVKDAADHGIDIELITRATTSHTSVGDQVQIIENFIQNQMDVIVISPAEVEAVKPALREVNAAGIPLIVVNMLDEIEGVDVTSFIGFDNRVAAMVSAYSMLDALGGPGVLREGEKIDVPPDTMMDLEWWEELYKSVDRNSISGKIAIIEGIAGDYFSVERNNGFLSVIEQFPNIEVKSILPADWNRQKGVDAAENILQNNKELDAIYASSVEMGLGASIAIRSAGRENEVFVITNDGTPESLDAIREGVLTAETWHGFPEWGWYGVKFATMLTLGQEVPYKFDIRPRTEWAGNADNFYPSPALEPIDWREILDNRK